MIEQIEVRSKDEDRVKKLGVVGNCLQIGCLRQHVGGGRTALISFGECEGQHWDPRSEAIPRLVERNRIRLLCHHGNRLHSVRDQSNCGVVAQKVVGALLSPRPRHRRGSLGECDDMHYRGSRATRQGKARY